MALPATTPARHVAPRLWVALALAVLVGALAPRALAQQPAYQPEFVLDAVAFKANDGDGPRLDVYTRVPYENLRFLRRDDGFAASYTVTASVYRTDGRGRQQGLALTRAWERAVSAPTYDATQADSAADFAVQSLELPTGDYVLEVELEDGASGRAFVHEAPVAVPAFGGAVAVSDLLIADRYDAADQSLTPNVANAVASDQEAFTLFYEIYAREAERLRVRYTVRRPGPKPKPSALRSILGQGEKDAEDGPRVRYESDDWLPIQAGRNPAALRIETEDLGVGDYTAELRLERPDGSLVAAREKAFTVRWMGLNDQIRDLASAVSQLEYVAKDRELRAMRRAETPEERYRLFTEFWDKRDPTPGTRRNERMEEYYYRVSYANRNYGRFSDRGWDTDQGEVFIRFGEPDFVENHPFDYGTKPYQIWYYNRIGRRFIFIDETGFGDFELHLPIWDERTRM